VVIVVVLLPELLFSTCSVARMVVWLPLIVVLVMTPLVCWL
jgi:hypothetical protein